MLLEQSYLILVGLVEGPAHGYRLIRDVERVSGGRVRLRAGTLYGALDRLASEGLIEVEREEMVEGRRRRYYRLTSPGRMLVADETVRRATTAAVATARLRAREADGV